MIQFAFRIEYRQVRHQKLILVLTSHRFLTSMLFITKGISSKSWKIVKYIYEKLFFRFTEFTLE